MQTHDALAPQLPWYEVRSVLITAHRRKRISLDLVSEGLSELRKLNIATTAMEDDALILHLASLYQLTAYDAAYLPLALDRNLQLATLDKQLIAAAPRAGCVLMTASS